MTGVCRVGRSVWRQWIRRRTIGNVVDVHSLSIECRRAGERDNLSRGVRAEFIGIHAKIYTRLCRVFRQLHEVLNTVLVYPGGTCMKLHEVRIIVKVRGTENKI